MRCLEKGRRQLAVRDAVENMLGLVSADGEHEWDGGGTAQPEKVFNASTRRYISHSHTAFGTARRYDEFW